MARSNITDRTIQLNSDDGAVLWSIVQGEQREFPITITSLDNINGYTFEATVIEAKNNLTAAMPTEVKTGGIVTDLSIRIPTYRGTFDSGNTYTYDDVVVYDDVTYRKFTAGNLAGILTVPSTDTANWETYTHNMIYIRFPKTFGDTWSPQPTPIRSVYGFFELSVTEPTSLIAYVQTYKPVRGLVESLFSPTDLSV
jgi:hypothetical protein